MYKKIKRIITYYVSLYLLYDFFFYILDKASLFI